MENIIEYRKNVLFREITIEDNSIVYTFDIIKLKNEDSNIYITDNVKIIINSVINDKVKLLVDDTEIILDIDNKTYNNDKVNISVIYDKPIQNIEKIKEYNIDELYDLFDKNEEYEYRTQINHLIMEIDYPVGLCLMALTYILNNDINKGIEYSDKAVSLNCYRGYYYLGRYYTIDENYEEGLNWFSKIDSKKKLNTLSEKNKEHYYEYIAICYYSLNNTMKAAYYAYQSIKYNNEMGWYLMYLLYNVDYFSFLPKSKSYMKYCLEQVHEMDVKETLEKYKDTKSMKPYFEHLDELKDLVKEDINIVDCYVEARNCQKKETLDEKRAEELLDLCSKYYFPNALSNYSLALNHVDKNKDYIYDDNGDLICFKYNRTKAMQLVKKGCQIHHYDSILAMVAYFIDETLDESVRIEEIKEYVDLLRKEYTDELSTDDWATEFLLDFDALYEEEIEKQNNCYLNKYSFYIRFIKLKHKFLDKKKIKDVTRKFEPVRHETDLPIKEIEKHVCYYLTYEYNEKLAYYYAYLGYEKNSEYCTYLLGVFHELGIYIPNIVSHAKYFYNKVNAKELKSMNYVNEVQPKKINFVIDDEFFTFDPVKAFLQGLKHISTDYNELPYIDAMKEGLSLLKKAADSGYVEAKYIMGCLYFDINQGNSRYWEKGRLIHLDSNPYLAIEYFNEAIEFGHENSMLIMASLHSYKGNNANKVQGKNDDILCKFYWNKIYKVYQYKFIKELGLTDDSDKMLFDFYGIRFSDIDQYLGKKFGEGYVESIKNSESHIELGNAMIAFNVSRLNNKYLFYKNEYNKLYEFYFVMNISRLLDNKDYLYAYDILGFAYKSNIQHGQLDTVAKKIKANDFEVEYLKLFKN